MSENSFIPDGYCGLFCASCPTYMVTQKGENEKLGLSRCQGCKSEVVECDWCSKCNLKSCAREKGLDFCYECDEYPCKDLDSFKNDPVYPYHSEVYDYMKIIKEKGKAFWLAEMKKRWSCESCGTPHNWWALQCEKCGAKTNGYKNPSE